MGFLRRLGWYLVGLSIGIIFLIFFLKKKSDGTDIEFCYFPNCRVLKDMRSKPLVFSDGLDEKFRDTLLIRSFLRDADIDFGRSDTNSEPCKTYFIEKTLKGGNHIMKAKNCKDKLIIENLQEDLK